MGQPTDPFLKLVEEAVVLHHPASEALEALRDTLDDLADQIKALEALRERADENYTRARTELEKVADKLYARLAELAEEYPQYQAELLEAIILIKLHLEGAEPDVTSTIVATVHQLLATPIDTPVVYLYEDTWHGCRTTVSPRLAWIDGEWWLSLIPNVPATTLGLDTIGDAQASAFGRGMLAIGPRDIRTLLRRLAAETRLPEGPGSIVDAVRDAGLPPGFLEPLIQ